MPLNTGLILQARKPRDWEQGGIVGAEWGVENSSGQWMDFLPEGEMQSRYGLETMSCVSQSFCNVHEIFLKKRGIDIDFSDRYLAKMSGTSKQGNTFWAVAEAARKYGMIKEEDWDWKPEYNEWSEYYAQVPVEVQEKTIEDWDYQYRWVDVGNEAIMEGLKYSPLQVCNEWHAFCIVGYDSRGWITYDSYPGGDGDFMGLWDFDKPFQSAMGHISTDHVLKPNYELPEEAKVWEAGGQTRTGLHVKGKLFVDENFKIDLQWQLRNRDPETNIFSGGKIIPVTPEIFNSFKHYNLKGERI